VLFDLDLHLGASRWDDDNLGSAILNQTPPGLNRTGRTREVEPWPPHHLRNDVSSILTSVGLHRRLVTR
jgi:hypothetical protein